MRRAVEYALRQGWASLRRSKTSSLFAIVAIALAVTVLGTLLLVTWNAERLLAQLSTGTEFSVYLDDDATGTERTAVESAIDASGVAAGREYVAKDQALTRFRSEFASLASIADGFDGNPFPASIEVRVREQAEAEGRAAALVAKIARMDGVADVRHDQEWLTRAAAGLATLRAVGFALAALMAFAAAVTVASVVRLGLHARRDEVEIMDLVGAPLAYIRGPFVAEGLIQGGFGSLVALVILWLAFMVGQRLWGPDVGALLDGGGLAFLPPSMWAGMLLGGMVVGAAGGLAAAWRAG